MREALLQVFQKRLACASVGADLEGIQQERDRFAASIAAGTSSLPIQLLDTNLTTHRCHTTNAVDSFCLSQP